MIQSILLFILGFLCAGFIALTIAPAIWRRAVALTRKRIEASVPLTMPELQAEKDRMRAEFAMSTRRLEMSVKSFREKAAAQIVDVTRQREEIKELTAEGDRKREAVAALESKVAASRASLEQREAELRQAAEKFGEAERSLEQQGRELTKLGRLYDDASFTSSTRQIEIVARESEIEKLSQEVAQIGEELAGTRRRHEEVAADGRAAHEALDAERKRAEDLEKRIQGMLTAIADREEQLDRRQKELADLDGRLTASTQALESASAELARLQDARTRLESELANAGAQIAASVPGARVQELEKSLAALSAERDRMEDRLRTLTRENKRLKEENARHERMESEDWSDEHRQGARLREEMKDLAAEVVRLTARLDGPDSPIAKALTSTSGRRSPGSDGDKTTSLADRVRALQKAASGG